MNYKELIAPNGELPLDKLVDNGGFCSIFRTIGCIGDSLSSGEFESYSKDGEHLYHDFFDYSWGQFMARDIGSNVKNFSCGGMTAQTFCESFGDKCGCFNKENICQAYIIALGVNDIVNYHQTVGTISDIDTKDWHNNNKTFIGYYGQIIQRIKEMQPHAKFFLTTRPRSSENDYQHEMTDAIYKMAEIFEHTYVLDFEKYAPVYAGEFVDWFFLGGHLNPAGYLLSAKMIESYIDYIIRHNIEDFKLVGFIGTPFENTKFGWGK